MRLMFLLSKKEKCEIFVSMKEYRVALLLDLKLFTFLTNMIVSPRTSAGL